jgi:putative spermidine/putrescine transport system substrate-binding protein
MFNRRFFLITATGLTLSLFVTGCNEEVNFKVLLLQGSLPVQLIAAFRKQSARGNNLVFKLERKLENIFSLLQTWQGKNNQQPKSSPLNFNLRQDQQPEKIANLVTLSNYWLNQAIQEELIEPFSLENITNWSKLPSKFINLITRNKKGELDEQGKVWGIPYRWGCTMIVYRQDKFKKLGWYPTDWHDLWREEISDRFSLPNQPREVIGLTLKKLGYSYNSKNLGQIPQLKSKLVQLHKQVKFYDSKNYLQPLILGDTWLAVGWSSDILPVIKRYGNLQAVIPISGTSLWADLWVKPKGNEVNSEILNEWLNFSFESKSINQISLFTNASSPLLFSLDKSKISSDILNNPLIYPPQELLDKSDFIIPLDDKINQQYEQLWKEIIGD